MFQPERFAVGDRVRHRQHPESEGVVTEVQDVKRDASRHDDPSRRDWQVITVRPSLHPDRPWTLATCWGSIVKVAAQEEA